MKFFTSNLLYDEWGVIGGDFHDANFHSLITEEIILFDFDLCGYGWRAYDVAVTYWSLFCTHLDSRSTFNLKDCWESFLRGYREIRILSATELAIIPTLAIVRHIWLIGSKTTYKDYVLDGEYWNISLRRLKELCNYEIT